MCGVVASLGARAGRDLVNVVTRAQDNLADIIYRSKCMEDLVALCKQVSSSDTAILITVKRHRQELLQAIHAKALAGMGLLCHQLWRPARFLLESELFGYEEGPLPVPKAHGPVEFGHEALSFWTK